MPIFDVEANGKQFEIEAPDLNSAASALQQHLGATPQQADAPITATGLGKAALSGVGSGVAGLAGLPGDAVDLATRGVDYLAGTKSNQAFGKTAGEYAGSGAMQGYIEKATGPFYKPQNMVERGLHTVGEFAPAALAGPGGIGRRVATQVLAPAAASEAAGIATQGTEYEPYARAGAALVGAAGATRIAQGLEKIPGASTAHIKKTAGDQYDAITSRTVATPIAQTELDNLAADILTTLNAKGVRPSTADKIHNAVAEIKAPATKGAPDVADIVSARQNIKSLLGSPDANKTGAFMALPKIDAAIERLAPGTMAELRAADKNWTAVKANEALDKKMARADLRAGGENSGLNLGNRIRQNVATYLLSSESRYISPADRKALEAVVKGTFTQNSLRLVSNLLGGGGGLGTTLLGVGGLAAGSYSGHPEAALLPVAGIGLRAGANAMTARQAAKAAAQIRNASPEGAKVLAALPPQRKMTALDRGLLTAVLARPALTAPQGLLGSRN